MTDSKRCYSYAEDTKALALLDILAFSWLTGQYSPEKSLASSVFTFFENCILPRRAGMLEGRPDFVREVPYAASCQRLEEIGHWYKEVSEGAINFIYQSDSAIFYSCSLTHLFRELSAVMGSAIVWAVPIRGAVSSGDLHHSEWIERPGTGICLYGNALTKAVNLEVSYSGKGKAMRIALDDGVVEIARRHPHLMEWLQYPTAPGEPYELKWWLGALAHHRGMPESYWLEWHFNRWFTEKHTKAWFSGPNCDDAKEVIKQAAAELRQLGR